MSGIKTPLNAARSWWHSQTKWEQSVFIGQLIPVALLIGVFYIVATSVANQMGDMYIAPGGWVIWGVIALFASVMVVSKLELPGWVVARIGGVDIPKSLAESLEHDARAFGEYSIKLGPYVIGALAIPIIVGVSNLYVIWIESGETLTAGQINTLLPMTAALTVIVAMVQLMLLMHAISPLDWSYETITEPFVSEKEGE